jgi:hypothetical protein
MTYIQLAAVHLNATQERLENELPCCGGSIHQNLVFNNRATVEGNHCDFTYVVVRHKLSTISFREIGNSPAPSPQHHAGPKPEPALKIALY